MTRKRSRKTQSPIKKIGEPALFQKTLVRILFFVNAALWLGYVVYIYYDMAVVNKNLTSADIVSLFVFVNAVAMLISGIQLAKTQKWTYYLALVVVGANLLLTLLNILDLFFLGVFLLDLFILFNLWRMRRNYLSNS